MGLKQKTMISRLLFFLAFILPMVPALAQRETDNWYFGQNASLEFNAAGNPASFQNSAMNAPSGSASISDRQGNLLFYTDGETIWNRLHQVMVNGSGLLGNKLATQPCIIIPKPGSSSLYFVIYLQVNPNGPVGQLTSLRYSVVDISAQNGIGEVVPASKNTVIFGSLVSANLSQKLTAVHHANNQEIWLIAHRFAGTSDHEFLSFKITATGITTTPVVSQLPYQAQHSFLGQGPLKVDPTGNWLAGGFQHGAILFKFNNLTGAVSAPLPLPNLILSIIPEFSPDGTKLYISSQREIYQFDLSSGVPASILASKITVATSAGISLFYTGMQLASNGKLYVGLNGQIGIGEFASPNTAGTASNYQVRTTLATGTNMRNGFPNFIQSYFAPPRFNYAGICAQSPTVFTIPNTTGIDSVRWNFGDPVAGTANTSTALQPSHTFRAPGVYTVQLNIFQQGFQSVFERDVTVMNKPLVQLPKDTSVCEGTPVYVSNLYPANPFNETFVWSNGNRDSTIMIIKKPGIYWLELSNGVCTTRDSIVVKHRQKPSVNLGPDRLQCGNAAIILNASNPGATYYWSPTGETTQTIAVTKPGAYTVTVTKNRCSATDDVSIDFNQVPGFDFGGDITVCEGEPVVLKTLPPGSGNFYTWSDSSTQAELTVKKSGKYWATVFSNGCTFSDTVNVTFKACPPPIVPEIPNIISPNNDDRNDKLVIGKIPLDAWSLKIYSRWGNLIYSADRYNNNWPEKELPDGTYFYLLEEPETNRKFKGWVEVVK